GRFTQDTPGAQRDKRGYSNREQRIGDDPARGENDDTRDHYTYRCAGIAEDMKRRCPHVQVTTFSLQAKTDEEIDDNTYSSREKHKQWLHRFWPLKALHRLEDDSQGDEDQCDSVNQRSQDA